MSSAPRTAFRKRYFPGATHRDWNDWKWQLRNRIKDTGQLEKILKLSSSERVAMERHGSLLPVGVTPYYASLLDPDSPDQGLRKTVVMVEDEYLRNPGESVDPLNEDGDSPVPGLVHRYPDRVLFLVTGVCPVYCRYCTRSRMVSIPASGKPRSPISLRLLRSGTS
jgi:lysine 2,3-aminomutase